MKSTLIRRIFVLLTLMTPQYLVLAQTVDLTVLATSDVHNNYLAYDYFTDMPTEQYGLVKLASAIKSERQIKKNVVLVDNGDLIQGNPLGDLLAKTKAKPGELNPIVNLLNEMGYDAITLGNHEFNFGLEYLESMLVGAKFPVVSANITKPGSDTSYFTSFALLNRSLTDRDGKAQQIKIGITGFAPPQIMAWDGASLRGKIETRDIYDSAVKVVSQMKKAGADVVILLAHTGISDFPRKGGEENAGYYLTNIPGVDAVVTGHAHMKFPGPAFAKLSGADIAQGTINGVPVVMPGSFADNLGQIDLAFTKVGKDWTRVSASAKLVPVYDAVKKISLLAADPATEAVLSKTHEAVLSYIRSPIGDDASGGTSQGALSAPLNSFFALVRDDYSVQIINEAQKFYAERAMKGTVYEKLPILSAAAPFKAGGRQGPKYYTNIPAGPLAVKNIADLYVYANTITVIKLKGSEIKEWLEMSAGQFNQIDPAIQEQQVLINDKFPTYNYDVIDGVTYTIDVSAPNRYNEDGTFKNGSAERIKNLRFQGKPIDPDQDFLVATNNYRANGGSNFPNVNPSKIVLASPDESRQVILKYIESKGMLSPSTDGNWELRLPKGSGPVIFLTSPMGEKAAPPGIRFLNVADTGYGRYQIER